MGLGIYSIVLIVNSISPHAVGIWSAYAQEVILRDFLAKETEGTGRKVSLTLFNDPFPLGRDFETGLQSIEGFLMAFGIGIVYIIVSPSLLRNVVEERELGLKNQMIVSGVKLPAYWLGHYVKDVCFGLILAVWIIILIAIFDIDVAYAWVLLLLGVLAIPPFLYAVGFMFDKADNSGGAVTFYMFLFAFLGPIAVFILQLIESTRDVAVPLKWALSIACPQFAVVSGVMFIAFK